MCQDCNRLHEELQKQAGIMYGLRKRITNLKGELKYERVKNAELVKENRQKQHYRNGQKRGRTRNG